MDEPEKNLIHRHLDPRLRGLVDAIAGYREQGSGLQSNPEYASLTIPLLIGFRAPFAIRFGEDGKPRNIQSFTSGLYPGTVFVDSAGDAECVQVNFTPLGARRFFGLPMSEFGGQLIEFDLIADRDLSALRARLGEFEDPHARLQMVEHFVIGRLRSAPPARLEVEHAFARLTCSSGRAPISELTDTLGWSRKRLSRVFREEIGETPKTVARIARFQNALSRLQSSHQVDLSMLAAECGYSDQAHMTREFTEYSGNSPGTLRLRG